MRVADTPFLFLDCQTTGRQPGRSHLLEIAWKISTAAEFRPGTASRSSLLAIPLGAKIPRQVKRMTGISERDLQGAPLPNEVWREVLEEVRAKASRASVIHYARFELAFLKGLLQEKEGGLPGEVICTHQIARKLLPELPSWGIRALAGYFGSTLPEAHRAAMHVEATMRIWHHLVERLRDEEGVETVEALLQWLRLKKPSGGGRRKTYLIARDSRLALPQTPGVYRFIARDGTLLYVGKATSLKERVNSYFRQTRQGGDRRDRLPEMLTQVSDIRCTETETALEAALLESEEIKRCQPPYNISLRQEPFALWFFSRDLMTASTVPDLVHTHGPFRSQETFHSYQNFRKVVAGEALVSVLFEGVTAEEFHAALSLLGPENGDWLGMGYRRLRAGKSTRSSDFDPRDPAACAEELEKLLARTVQRLLKARLICRMADACVVWRPTSRPESRRLIETSGAKIVRQEYLEPGAASPHPETWRSSLAEKRRSLDPATYDQLRILVTSVKTLADGKNELELRLSPSVRYGASTLKRLLT